MNIPDLVNIGTPDELETEFLLKRRLEELLSEVPWLNDRTVTQNVAPHQRTFDLRALISFPGGNSAELYVECRNLPRPSQFPSVTLQNEFQSDGTKNTIVPVLAAPWVSPRMADLCLKHGWSWYDLAGNCHISIPDGIYIERTGFDPIHLRPKPEANLSTPESARVIRALLAPMNAGRKWTQRDLKSNSEPEVSLGLVNKVVRYLREQAYLMDLPQNGGFKLHDPIGLLEEWKEAYRFDRHYRRDYFTLHHPPRLRAALLQLSSETDGHAVFAAFSAAELQALHVPESRTWLYIRRDYEDLFVELAEAKPVDTGANVVVFFPQDDGVFYGRTQESNARLPCTNPVQTYVDLCHSGGRGMEAAEALLNQRLIPKWKEAGLSW